MSKSRLILLLSGMNLFATASYQHKGQSKVIWNNAEFIIPGSCAAIAIERDIFNKGRSLHGAIDGTVDRTVHGAIDRKTSGPSQKELVALRLAKALRSNNTQRVFGNKKIEIPLPKSLKTKVEYK